MIELELEINGVDFHLFEEENKNKIRSSKAKIIGFFGKRLIKPTKGEKIYFSKNCYIGLFKSLKNQEGTYIDEIEGNVLKEFVFGPSGKEQKYLSGTWSTSIYLHYINSILNKITFQCINNRIMAKKVISEFEKRMVKIYGKPVCIIQNENRICTWSDSSSKVLTEVNDSIQNSYIHWFLKDH